MDPILFLLGLAVDGMGGFQAGCLYQKEPSEEIMLKRLIHAEAARRINAKSETEIKHEIDEAAKRIAT